jgi:hypothetical protein
MACSHSGAARFPTNTALPGNMYVKATTKFCYHRRDIISASLRTRAFLPSPLPVSRLSYFGRGTRI